MDLPNGTVTFLLTDVEASTRHWDTAPDAMRAALELHDALAEEIIRTHGGLLLKSRGEGDSLFSVFDSAQQALAAAIALQFALSEEEWTTPLPLAVRMALHTGEAQLRDGDYYGPAVNRCARLRSLAYGGQILLSAHTRDLVCRSLPPGILLRDEGQRHLKGLQEPEHVFAVVHPALRTHPPLHSALDSFPNNLPRQLTSFVGRERELTQLLALLKVPLVTLTGAGGCGKTRLALQVAEQVWDAFPDGIWLVELGLLSDPSRVPQAVASVVRVREEAGHPLMETLIEALRTKSVLLILDNCEHLLQACCYLVEDLLQACPNLRILATSRESLNIGGETVFYVPSLSIPDPKRLPPIDHLTEYEAIRLFIDRAAAATASFSMSAKNASAVAKLCHRLDGIPLAIELAAVRVKSLPVEQIAERLADRFRLLTGGSRTALPRQQTLRALIDWSYDLLSERERELFHRISVFVSGFTLEAAEFVCSTDEGLQVFRCSGVQEKPKLISGNETQPKEAGGALEPEYLDTRIPEHLNPNDVLDLLTALVDKSLLIAEEDEGRVRYRMLETLRQYAREKLAESEIEPVIQDRHLAYFLQMAEEAERKLRGSEQAWWLERLDTEHDNLRAALAWSLASGERGKEKGERGGEVHSSSLKSQVSSLSLAGALWWFWHVRGYFSEGREWLGQMLAAISDRTADRAKALNGAAVLARNQGDFEAARVLSLESLEIKRELGDRQGIASSLNNLAQLALSQGDFAAAQPFYEESLAIERKLGNRQGMTASLIGLGNVALEQGDYAAARSLYEESLAIKRELGDKRGIATSLFGLGNVALYAGDYAIAFAPHEESLSIRRHLGDRRGIANSLEYLGVLAITTGDLAAAAPLLAESLAIRRELGDKSGIANALHEQGIHAIKSKEYTHAAELLQESLAIFHVLGNRHGIASSLSAYAQLAIAAGDSERAARLIGAADAIRKSIGCPLHAYERKGYDACLDAAKTALGEETVAAARAAGRSMSIEQAVIYAKGRNQ